MISATASPKPQTRREGRFKGLQLNSLGGNENDQGRTARHGRALGSPPQALRRRRYPKQPRKRISMQLWPPVLHYPLMLRDWTAALDDTYQHDDKRQHEKKMDEAA